MDYALSLLIRRILEKTTFRPEEVGDVVTGCAFQTGENWLYGGRHPVLLAGLPVTVPAMAMDRACASSMNAAAEGAMEVMTGNSDVVLAGGMEHLTHVPMSNNPALAPNTRLLTRPEYMKYQMSAGYSMGLTAEKLAEQEGFTREEMDRFSMGSHVKAPGGADAETSPSTAFFSSTDSGTASTTRSAAETAFPMSLEYAILDFAPSDCSLVILPFSANLSRLAAILPWALSSAWGNLSISVTL